MVNYYFGSGVLAFTAGRGDRLPVEVTQAQQVHEARVARVDCSGLTKEDLYGYDAMITDVPGLAIGVRTADCIPILLYDEPHRAIAAVHSGWKGTVKRISLETISRMREEYSTDPSDLKAVIGPGICRDCFQVGEEVVDIFREAGFPMDEICFRNGPKIDGDMKSGYHIDLTAANRHILLQAGIPEENISISEICTFDSEILYSARREGTKCGRNINAIMLK